MYDDEKKKETIEILLKEFVRMLDVVDQSRLLLDHMEWTETPNERLMFIRSDIPGGPKVLRDRLKNCISRIDSLIDEGEI